MSIINCKAVHSIFAKLDLKTELFLFLLTDFISFIYDYEEYIQDQPTWKDQSWLEFRNGKISGK